MKIFIILCLTGLHITRVCSVFTSLDQVRQECERVETDSEKNVVIEGWPFMLNCDRFVRRGALPGSFSDSSLTVCQLWNATESIQITNKTVESIDYGEGYFDLEPVEDGTNFTMSLLVDGGRCFFEKFNLTFITPMTCDQFVANRKPLTRKPNLNSPSSTSLECNAAFEDVMYPKLPESSRPEYGWIRNCSLPPISTEQKLTISNASIENHGIYLCFQKFGRITRYFRYDDVCIRRGPTRNTGFDVNCIETSKRRQVGDTATFSCEFNLHDGKPRENDLSVKWSMASSSNISCSEQTSTKPVPANSRRFCVVDFGSECLTSPEITIPMTFTISNITDDDYGSYMFMAESFTKTNRLMFKIELLKDEVSSLYTAAEITGICIGILIAFVLISLIVFYNSVYVKVFYKRWFAAYVENDRSYAVFLAYHFSQESDQFAQDTVKTSVPKILGLLKQLGYLVYDEKQHFEAGGRADNILEPMRDCHRVMILLSDQYIKDDWSLFALTEGFNEMVNSGTRLVFILLPGVKEYVKQMAKNVESPDHHLCQTIQRALKINYVIEMPDQKQLNSNRFAFQLENTLPKLRGGNSKPVERRSSGYLHNNHHDDEANNIEL